MIIEVWQRTMDLAKTGTTGMDTEDEWNSKANSAQKILQQMLIDASEINQKATDALSWLKKASGELTSGANGAITMPTDYLQLDTVAYVNNSGRFPATKLATNGVEMTRTSPIRKPNIATNDINYYFKESKMFVMPEQAGIKVDFMYYKKVPDASIVLTPVSDGDGDLVTPEVDTDFGWPDQVFNLLVYTILEQLGIELKEEWLYEYSQFGISRDMIKTTA